LLSERERLRAWRIAACDQTDTEREQHRKAKNRERMTARRRQVGVKPRAAWLASSLSKLKPWEAEGISRRTWERRRVADVCATILNTNSTHLRQTPEQAEKSKGQQGGDVTTSPAHHTPSSKRTSLKAQGRQVSSTHLCQPTKEQPMKQWRKPKWNELTIDDLLKEQQAAGDTRDPCIIEREIELCLDFLNFCDTLPEGAELH
jgi:hypothetical protein